MPATLETTRHQIRTACLAHEPDAVARLVETAGLGPVERTRIAESAADLVRGAGWTSEVPREKLALPSA